MVYMHVCICVCARACTYVRVWRMYVYVYVTMAHVCVCVCVLVLHMRVCVCGGGVSVCMRRRVPVSVSLTHTHTLSLSVLPRRRWQAHLGTYANVALGDIVRPAWNTYIGAPSSVGPHVDVAAPLGCAVVPDVWGSGLAVRHKTAARATRAW
jgi:hypothetical protein